ncbi:hypothetical protein [Spiroplasma endosymbiont of Amphibalanus improvisus]|uniref:hypothetical protein n=1 Tax=Spiroplasma endosymbiont of Amphibalanus improvisus TaxID=3066327 RepID=UPI00313C6A8A
MDKSLKEMTEKTKNNNNKQADQKFKEVLADLHIILELVNTMETRDKTLWKQDLLLIKKQTMETIDLLNWNLKCQHANLDIEPIKYNKTTRMFVWGINCKDCFKSEQLEAHFDPNKPFDEHLKGFKFK